MDSKTKRIVIIGAGISGISAALEAQLLAPDSQVLLLESSNRLGGVLETLKTDGYLIERSADNFATLIPNARDLSQRLGLLPSLIHPNAQGRQAFVFSQGRSHPIPAGFSLMQPTRVMSILATRVLSPSGKLRLLREYWVPRRSDSATDESLESFAIRRLGKEAFERLVEPIVSGIFTANPKTLSMAATMPQFLQMEREHGGLIRGYLASKRQDAAAAARRASGARYDQFMAPREGMSSWIEALASHLTGDCIRLNTPVTRIEQQADKGWMISAGINETIRADGLILATPAKVTAALLGSVDQQASNLIGSIPYASSAVVAMIVDRQTIQGRLDGFGLVVPSCENRQALAVSFTSNKYPGRTPDDQVLLRVFLGGSLHPEVLQLNDDQLRQIAIEEVSEILKWNGQGLKWSAVIRWNEAMPQYLVGHVEKVKQIEQRLESLGHIQVCGAAYNGVGIPQCIRSSQSAVNKLLQQLSA